MRRSWKTSARPSRSGQTGGDAIASPVGDRGRDQEIRSWCSAPCRPSRDPCRRHRTEGGRGFSASIRPIPISLPPSPMPMVAMVPGGRLLETGSRPWPCARWFRRRGWYGRSRGRFMPPFSIATAALAHSGRAGRRAWRFAASAVHREGQDGAAVNGRRRRHRLSRLVGRTGPSGRWPPGPFSMAGTSDGSIRTTGNRLQADLDRTGQTQPRRGGPSVSAIAGEVYVRANPANPWR